MRCVALLLVALLAATSCTWLQVGPRQEIADAAELTRDWRPLFDGHSLAGWRGYRSRDEPAGWSVEDGAIHHSGSWFSRDLVTRERFADFELAFEWKISASGNSGVVYRCSEARSFCWQTGAEYQVLDPAESADTLPVHRAGSNYAIAAPKVAAKPAGEWNRGRIVARGARVEHWLNGELASLVEVGSDDWLARVADSKFARVEGWGVQPEGHIALQAHGSEVWYRDLRIRAP